MKPITLTLAILAAAFALAGCTTAQTLAGGVAEKAVSGTGVVTVQRVGLNATTQTPELFNLFVKGTYASITDDLDFIQYHVTEDSSIFNSAAKSRTISFTFGSSSKERTDAVVTAVVADIQSRIDPPSEAPDPSDPSDEKEPSQ